MPKLEVVELPTSELVEYARNAKMHPHLQIDQIANSISEFGNNDPIAVWHNEQGEPEIVEGHGRLMALRKLGIETTPVIYLDHLSDEQRRAYALVHNKLTMNSDFDFEILPDELAALDSFDMGDFGFDVPDLNIASKPAEIVEDEVPDDAPSVCKLGDIWQLGEHRLMCGDSTDADSVSRLMDGNRADVCFTSPPYNMGRDNNYESAPNPAMLNSHAYKSYDDSLSDSDYAELLCDAMGNALSNSDNVMFNIGVLKGSKYGIVEMLHRYSKNFCEIVVWNKSQSMPYGMPNQAGMLSHRCEPIFAFNQDGSRNFAHPQWKIGQGINRIDTVNCSGNEYAKDHGATFPVEFAAEVVKNFTDKSVLDLFGGTGTTLIAAEQLGRTCYMMELDPQYCDIIIKRWEGFTGRKAVKADG